MQKHFSLHDAIANQSSKDLTAIPSICNRDCVLVKFAEASEVGTELGVSFLCQRITSVQQDGQTERFQRTHVLLPSGIVKLETERCGAIVTQVQDFCSSLVAVSNIYI
jgi:hypothetical protein